MPIDLDKANANKELILSTLTNRGPSLPVHLSQAAQLSPLFASAFLSELYSEGKVKISNMKVGSSPLYMLPGQEPLLEKFIDYLNAREKEALYLLKKEKILDDELQTPVVRVALRAIKDFAIPLKITHDGKEKMYWKYFLVNDSEIRQIIEKPKKEEKQETLPVHQKKEEKQETPVEKIEKEQKSDKPEHKHEIKGNEETSEQKLTTSEKPKKKKIVESKFLNNIKDYLTSKDIEILDIIEEKKKEFYAKIRIDSLFGKQEYYLVAKEKKKINETDLVFTLQKANELKMPSLIMAPGELDKKALEYYKSWKNIIKFEKVKF